MHSAECVKFLKRTPFGRQLVLLPYLGGYANSFSELARHLDDDLEVIAVNPPGHGPCRRQPLRRIDQMTELYARALSAVLRPGYLMLGHSMGGLVSYALIDRLPFKPDALVLSGANPPHVVARTLKKVSHLPVDQIIAYLVSLGGIPEALLKERELLEFCLPSFRADFEALETASFEERVHDIEAHIVYGVEDPLIDPVSVTEWRSYFPRSRIARMQGGHMFIKESPAEMASYIRKIARDCA